MAGINIKIGTISSKFHYPYEGMFGSGSTPEYIIKTVTGNGYADLTNAVANQLIYVKLFGGTEQRNLPSEYTQLEYITLNKGYFDTGITPTTNTDYELKFTIAQNNTTQGVMGMLNNSTPTNNFYFMVSSGNKFLSALGSSATTLNGLADAVVDTDYLVKVNGETLTVNDVEATNFARGTLEATQTINLGCRKNSENNGLTGKLYYFKIWKGGVLVAHYIPCKRISDDVLGYYDMVNNTFGVLLTSYGTPVAGQNAVPTPTTPIDIVCNNGVIKAKHQSGLPLGYTLLDYITFDGQSYIDTGYTVSLDDEIQTKLKFTSTGFVYGASTAVPRVTLYGSPGGNQRWGSKYASVNGVPASNTDLTIKHNKDALIINNTTMVYDSQEDFTTADTLTIGNDNGNTTTALFSGNLYYFKFLKDGVLVRDYVPAKDSNDTVGLFDMVSGTFFTNDGTGTLTAGSTISDPIEIYIDGTVETVEDELNNTATAEMLLAIGDYKDIQEVLSGDIIRKIGIKVLDGTENWSLLNQANYVYGINISDAAGQSSWTEIGGICTHLVWYTGSTPTYTNTPANSLWFNATRDLRVKTNSTFATLNDWKQYLKDQYATGTPVIVVYPLATATTESVSGQTLNIQDGSNTIEITQASISNLPLEVQYKATE